MLLFFFINCYTYNRDLHSFPTRRSSDLIIPYGWMVNQHVTPIDHEYFAPLNWDSPRDSYEVRAPADGYITQIQHRTSDYSSFTHGKATDEYRVIIAYTCTFLSYFDLITSLSPDIQF